MYKSKLIQLLKTFSAAELKQFREFTASPYFNKNKNVISLLEVLKKYYPEFNSKKLESEEVFKEMFPDEEYDYFKIKNISSDLLAISKEFLKISYFQKNDHLNNKFLLEQFRDRDLDKMHEQLFKSYSDSLTRDPVRDEAYFLKMSDLSKELKSFYSPKNPNSDFELFQDQLDNELNHFLINALELYTTMLHEIKQNNCSFDLKMFDEVMIYLEKNFSKLTPVIQMYYYITLLLMNNDQNIFYKLKDIFKKHSASLNEYHTYMYYLHMSGFCAEMYNIYCSKDFMKEHFYLSKDSFDTGTIFMGKIMYLDFLNYVKIAVRVGEFDWAEKYIEQYKGMLNEEKESTLNFCYGYIEFKKGSRSKALELLSKTNFPNYIIKLQVKIIMLQIFYEEGFYDQAVAGIDSFRHFLGREKSIKDNYKESFSDFLKITGELVRLQQSVYVNNKKHVEAELMRLREAADRSSQNQFGIKLWLFDMLNSFKK